MNSSIYNDFDIAKNIKATVSYGKDGEYYKTIETDYFKIKLPRGNTCEYEVVDNMCGNKTIYIYNTDARKAGCGGELIGIYICNIQDVEEINDPGGMILDTRGEKVLMASFPTDVRADSSDEKHMDDYFAVWDEVYKVMERAPDSPLILK